MEGQYRITAEHVTGWIDHHESLNKIWLVMRDKNPGSGTLVPQLGDSREKVQIGGQVVNVSATDARPGEHIIPHTHFLATSAGAAAGHKKGDHLRRQSGRVLCGPRNRCHLCEKKLLNVGHVSGRPRSKLERRRPSILEVKSCVIVGNEMLRRYCEEKRYEKANQIHLCLDAMTEQRDRGSGAGRSWTELGVVLRLEIAKKFIRF
jgi:hypothetical protein